MYKRYENTRKINNFSDRYRDVFEKKNLLYMKQYSSFRFNKVNQMELDKYDFYLHTFQHNEKLYNISYDYYNSPEFGWLILYTNKIASEFMLKDGDMLSIYYPLNDIINLVIL